MVAIILAAGLSTRFGKQKLLVEVNHKPMLLHVIELVERMDFEKAVLVYHDEDVKKLAEGRNIKCVCNKEAEKGLSTSIRCGIQSAEQTDAYIFFPGDQPFIDKETVRRLMEAFYRGSHSIVVPRYSGRHGNPAVFSARWKDRLQSLTGDIGGRAIIIANSDDVLFVDIPNEQAGMDIDTYEELEALGETGETGDGSLPRNLVEVRDNVTVVGATSGGPCIRSNLVVVRGGGDIASGTIHKLTSCGFRVVVLEIEEPTVVRRTVAFAQAVFDGAMTVEGCRAVRVDGVDQAFAVLGNNEIPVLVDPVGKCLDRLKPEVVVDCILAKRNLGTHKGMAPVVIGLGPGFSAPEDVHAIIETNRGHNLGRVIYNGSAEPNTGHPGIIGGYGRERVIRASASARIRTLAEIGDSVKKGQTLAYAGDTPVFAPLDGVLRGLIHDGVHVAKGCKIGDVDPRNNAAYCRTISDKARAIAGGVLEAILHLQNC